MPNPTTPGVSIRENARLPYSVSLSESAVPAFIGYTELQPAGYTKPLKISSLLEYEQYFGKAKKENIRLKDTKEGVTLVAPQTKFLMYYSLQLYFANGGGPCYIVSAGTYSSASSGVQRSALETGLEMTDTIKQPVLLVFPDAVSLEVQDDFYGLYNQAIAKADVETKNRFALLDTYYGNLVIQSDNKNTVEQFRDKINTTSHAAAYFPHLETMLNYTFDETGTPVTHTGLQATGQSSAAFYAEEIAAIDRLKILAADEISSGSENAFVLAGLMDQAIAIAEKVKETADVKVDLTTTINNAKGLSGALYDGVIYDFDENAPLFDGEFEALKTAVLNAKDEKGDADGILLKDLESSHSALYNQVKEAMGSLKVILPPSSAMAGVYARTDRMKGPWKAPANVSLNYVVAPAEKISDQDQSDLNIHSTGKSINAIRAFSGKGNLVWGARTLSGKDKKDDGKDNEWKYIQVRRYYDMIRYVLNEVFVKSFIDEPNISFTWLHARTTVENFLNQQWKDGALAGSTPQEAYHVEAAGDKTKPKTMNVIVKIALVRPAEFIVLNFSHQL
ncbi:phage tail sheath family protein [Chryseobacterium sp. SN22]|uniref:phage tail sheath C-terminal domain-containing protein n=1 Tax=Chryseobacterium sp. SN22 TaxID=2606431 RepID=UPI0011F04B8B|nr:phage tail sheath C-terminal domain-containing protein [Chryseobacterium sp. SN22]KAA0129343.1 phage tail sheath family protein [Chryseobacterium sp. SN22]